MSEKKYHSVGEKKYYTVRKKSITLSEKKYYTVEKKYHTVGTVPKFIGKIVETKETWISLT